MKRIAIAILLAVTVGGTAEAQRLEMYGGAPTTPKKRTKKEKEIDLTKYAPKKPVLVGEIGALSTCPERALTWLNAAKTRLQAHDVLAINWNLRTNADQEYNPLLQDDIRQWWLDWASEATGERAEGAS